MKDLDKCRFCRYDRIDHILIDDILIDRCLDCGFARYSSKEIGILLRSKIQHKNLLNSRQVDTVSQLSKKDQEIYETFISYFNFKRWRIEEHSHFECNVCGDRLIRLSCPELPEFTVFYCEYCGNLYFYPSNLDEAVDRLMEKAIFSNKWYSFIFKIFK